MDKNNWFYKLFINEAKAVLRRDTGGAGVDSALPIEISTEADMNALLEIGEDGGVYKYTGETTADYENGAVYILSK